MKVQTRLFILVGVLTVLLIIVGILGLVAAQNANEGLKTVYNDRVVPLDQLKKISDMYAVNIVDTCHKVRNGNLGWEEGINNINEARKKIDENWKAYIATMLVEQEKVLVREIDPLFKRADNATETVLNIMKKRNADEISKYTINDMYPAIDPVTEKIDQLIKIQLVVAKEEYLKSDALYSRNRTLSAAVIVFGILAALGIALFIIRNLLRQLGGEPSDVVNVANRLANGDMTVNVNLKPGDNSSALFAIKSMVEGLEKMISDVIERSQGLAQAVEQIASGNKNLSQRTSEQASALEEIASTIEETAATINQNAENSENVNKMAEASSKMAIDGGNLVSKAVSSINEVSKSSKKISEIINVINEISFQTNLLALNAAVEAARAGEQGRGFAVVAGEVRNLAQRSGNAAKEIGALIKESIEKIDLGNKLSNESGDALNEIINSVKNVGNVISEIACANQEQKSGVNQINIAVTEMDNMTQQNAALVEETASASEEMATQAQELLAIMDKFKINKVVSEKSLYQLHG